jgi:hypothetical protein
LGGWYLSMSHNTSSFFFIALTLVILLVQRPHIHKYDSICRYSISIFYRLNNKLVCLEMFFSPSFFLYSIFLFFFFFFLWTSFIISICWILKPMGIDPLYKVVQTVTKAVVSGQRPGLRFCSSSNVLFTYIFCWSIIGLHFRSYTFLLLFVCTKYLFRAITW